LFLFGFSDVVNHLNTVRGKGMASMYSWSCKWYSARNASSFFPYSCWVLIIPSGCFDFRSYKNGFVWHDLAEDDLVLPAADGEYILKGSELVDHSSPGIIPNFLLLNFHLLFCTCTRNIQC
jgi:hypothetical protein